MDIRHYRISQPITYRLAMVGFMYQFQASPIDSLHVTPIVRVIDNFVTNHHLANVFEAKVGNGKLVFSSMDLHSNLENRPAAQQLRQSLLDYIKSDAFDPISKITVDQLGTLKLE